MELMTPQILWKDFDAQLPFDETVVKFTEENGIKIKEFYFSGLRTQDGVVRIFAKYLHNGDKLPTLVYFGEETESLKIPEVKKYNFLTVDYTGIKKNKSRGTLYPYSLKDAEFGQSVYNLSPKASRWFAWASVAMYAVLYAQKNCGNGQVGVIGAGQGGSLVWKLSACVGAEAGVTLYSTGYEPDIDDIYYRACLDNRSYAPILRFPVMEIVSSNESDGSIDFMSEIYAGIKRSDCRICINERANHTVGEAGKRNVEQWLSHYFYGEGKIPEVPTLRPYESGGKLYYEVKHNGKPDEIDFYTCIGNAHGSLRNWSNVKLMKLEDSYLAPINVYDANSQISAFVTIKEFGYKISSTIISRVPSKMGVSSQPVKRNRLVYDGDMGPDDWASSEGEKPEMKEGPFGINGVCADKSLMTYKLADARYRGIEGSFLQIMYCSSTKQEIKFIITDSKKRIFSTSVDADIRQGWVSKTLALDDFKSQNEQLLSWKDVATFEIKPSQGTVLISSLLWV